MQFAGKLMNQTWKPNLGSDFDPNLVLKTFFGGFYLYKMLYIVASYHFMQFQGKLINQT